MKHWLGPHINEVVLRGLAKDPSDRYQTAAEFSQAIYGLIQECLKAGKEAADKGAKLAPPPKVAPASSEPLSSASVQESHSSPVLTVKSQGRTGNVRMIAFVLIIAFTAIAVRLAVRWSLG
jgi:hypothetical protein